MFGNLLSLEFRRERLLKKSPPGPLRDFLSVPFPSPKSDCRDVSFLALDLETTGLEANRGEIVSIGYVEMNGFRIDLGSATHRLVVPEGAIPEQSAVIHQITDDAAAEGESLEQAVTELLKVLAGKVLIAHHAPVEFSFLGAACETIWGGRFLIPMVDTEWIERRTLERRGQTYAARELRLSRLRERYGLPRYRAHDALVDALAAAELFSAQIAARDSGGRLPLKEFLTRL
ncbi:exonuclease domain-containing protein [Thiohalomonas denitrificans]|uniref:DNA polymerase-3 subunit epsilon n=1 Tax=Thiohalomonas denitrificans TaxID=415747 RepID=A0A1G5PIY9_9GAMM|nr:exonuclease domain-containing protein [Thiohalomonas denitrificans]SCZ49376.1 DNA polymerase-3 subunit epsilon [Thiohalomonas denitrificans]